MIAIATHVMLLSSCMWSVSLYVFLAGKNLFGQYTNKPLKEWDAIVALFSNGSLFLVDAARSLTQLVNYDMYVTTRTGIMITTIIVLVVGHSDEIALTGSQRFTLATAPELLAHAVVKVF